MGRTDALTKQLATSLTDDLGVTDSGEVERVLKVLAKLEKIGEAATPAAPAVIPLLGVLFHDEGGLRALRAMIPEIVARDFVAALESPTPATLAALAKVTTIAEGAVFEDPALPAFFEVMRDTALPRLIALADKHPEVLHPLGLLGAGDKAALAALVARAGHEDEDVRMGVAFGLGHFGDAAVAHLDGMIDMKNRSPGGVNSVAVSSLARIGTKRALAVLKKVSTMRGGVGRLAMDLPRLVATERTKVANRARSKVYEAKRTRSADLVEVEAEAKALESKARQLNRGAAKVQSERKAAMKPRSKRAAAKPKPPTKRAKR